MSDSLDPRDTTYLNPVYDRSFPDPFVFKFEGSYFAYSTGFAPDGNVFEVLRSNDLVKWSALGGAMAPLENSPPYYWAPEVFYCNGRFYLYYSVGNETLMEIRVATSERPDRGFVDSGRRLTHEDFAIDAHLFVDDDGTRFLFYATDFLDHTHIGTGTVVDRMVDPFTLEGKARPVTRAKYDWQVYDPQRKEKGGVRWHTVEGPTVLKRKGLYYEMFSGGNWQNTTYGVSYAISDRVSNDDEWLQYSDGENVLPILRTVPDIAIGPGHNCVVRGPNNRELYCVYHRWTDAGRVMAIDRMDFAGERIFIIGATSSPQPAPFRPTIREVFRSTPISPAITMNGGWTFSDEGAACRGDSRCEMTLSGLPDSFLVELTWSLSGSQFIVSLAGADGSNGDLIFDRDSHAVRLDLDGATSTILLPEHFDWAVRHLLRIEMDHRNISIEIDDRSVRTTAMLMRPTPAMTIVTERNGLRLTALELTEGYEELFVTEGPLSERGWTIIPDIGHQIINGELIVDQEDEWAIQKGRPLESFEIAANFRTLEGNPTSGEFGLTLSHQPSGTFTFLVNCSERCLVVEGAAMPLPQQLVLAQYHQLRILKRKGVAFAYFDDLLIGEFPVDAGDTTVTVSSSGVKLGMEMIRLTSLESRV